MASPRRPDKAKLVAGLLLGDTGNFLKVKKALERIFGRADFESRTLDFSHTDYYAQEMGEGLKRKFLSFEKPVDLKNICNVKLRTNALEKRFSRSGRRTVNIDPGYLDLSKVVLFSTKDYSHRVYLDKGIFAEVTLFYKDRTFNPWPWTYPDYRTKAYIDIFNSIRENYIGKRRLKVPG